MQVFFSLANIDLYILLNYFQKLFFSSFRQFTATKALLVKK